MLGPNGVLADLICWGRDGSDWFALVAWSVYGNTPSGTRFVHQSAWVPAQRVVRSADPGLAIDYRNVERLDLSPDRDRWPTPAASKNRRWLHHGAITEPLPAAAREVIDPIPQPRPGNGRLTPPN